MSKYKKVLIYIIIAVICIAAIIFCIFLLRSKKNNSFIKNIIIPIIIGLVVTFISCCVGAVFGNPIIVIGEILDYFMKTVETTSEPKFEQKISEEFNYKIDYPLDFTFEGSTEQYGDEDFTLSSQDRRATLVFIARHIEGDLPEKFTIDYFRRTYAGTEIYSDNKLKNDGWYAISTKTADGIYHYRKCIFTDGIVRMFTFSFPTDQEDIYLSEYDYVTHIEKSFRKLHY